MKKENGIAIEEVMEFGATSEVIREADIAYLCNNYTKEQLAEMICEQHQDFIVQKIKNYELKRERTAGIMLFVVVGILLTAIVVDPNVAVSFGESIVGLWTDFVNQMTSLLPFL